MSDRRVRLGAGFGRLWAGNASANLADGILLAGLPVLATTVTTAPGLVAGVQVVLTAAMCVAALPAGVAADRAHRGRVVVVADLVRALGLAVTLVVTWRYGVGIGAVYAAALLAGSTQVLADATSEAAVPDLVDGRHLERANSRMVGTQVALNQAVGAPVGSVLAAVGATLCLGMPAALYALAGAIVTRVRIPRTPGPAPRVPLRRQLADGVRPLRTDPSLGRLAVSNSLMNFGHTAFFAIAVLLVIGPMGLSRSAYGLLLSAVAVGGVLGAVAARRTLDRLGPRRVMAASRFTAAACYGVLALAGNAAVAMLAAVALGSTGTVWNVASRTVRQRRVPSELLGRVTTAMMLVSLVMAPLGGLAAGAVAELYGVRTAPAIAVLATLASLVVLRGIDVAPAPRVSPTTLEP